MVTGGRAPRRKACLLVPLQHKGRIDHVLSAWPRRGGAGHPVHCEVIGDEPVGGVVASDHYGVLADLRY